MNNAKFNELDKYFRENKFEKLESDTYGERFLKLRTISRSAELKDFCEFHNIDHINVNENLFCFIFKKQDVSIAQVNEFIKTQYQRERTVRQENEAYLIDQLCRLPYFDWGGSFGNSLEKNIVDNYVKKIKSYQEINDEVEGSLLVSLRGYTLNSWYNHWTSIIIEDIFKDHDKVLPTVGLVKKIDFFINDTPFDLKVTYFPQELMNVKLKALGYAKERQNLMAKCLELGLAVDEDSETNALKSTLNGYQQIITDFIKNNRTDIEALKQKCTVLSIEFVEEQEERKLKKQLLDGLRNYREGIKTYISSVRYQAELTRIKNKCEELNIVVPDDMSDKALEQHLYNKLSEENSDAANEFVAEFKELRRQIINEAEQNPAELKKWLYENQGEARFDASNRFFLILTDENDIYDSWKLKRSINFLREKINTHLNEISNNSADLELDFFWKKDNKTYKCKSDILFVKKGAE
ncbi:MAG: hypothetical protein HN778_03435 [Prolixibacteraceae bacterium]|jgi:hypothetical protein|nr:hypothetical protein [Prolixibacteraceae bacterium]